MAREKMLLVVGASAGGTTALPLLIRQLTADMSLSVMVVLHLSKTSIGELLAKRLQTFTSLKCKIAQHGEAIKKGHVYVAMPDHHLIVKQNRLLLGRGPMENRYRPSIDALFRSAAVAFTSRVIGIIMTGMLDDGASGMHAIKKCGGICIVQDPDEAKYPDMPQAVLNTLKPHFTIGVNDMGDAISKAIDMLKGKKKGNIPPAILKEAEIAERVNVGIEQVQDLGELSAVSCPDCGGSLWEIKDNGLTRYRCHVGHSFSQVGLISNMEASTESTLWIALRMIEEGKNLLMQLGRKESGKGKSHLADTYFKRSRELEIHTRRLKDMIFSATKHPRSLRYQTPVAGC